ncbi:class I SAM-dependent methyltransferase [Microlunatus parietis]|uniref:SAM-dependent methyltransferase n=1 Tax=Microlunatus parietis TaxID=682979 RepID=A0A7Y9ICI9_9ACTN|nr:class I SAM-dependent methyltransferase [Microlunatus parietis]NYE74300.1 SAM-dependent methyltransferase [Microlunatus parietis]
MSSMSQRDVFDESAAIYQAARPAYPAELFDDLITATGLRPPSELLEIGAGPGTATVDVARRGFKITAVELGPGLAEQARRNLAAFPLVSVITGGFEEWEPPAGTGYDLVYSANVWHWLDPQVRWTKAAALLAPGGWLAVFGARHAFPDGYDPFFDQLQPVYQELGEGAIDWPPAPPRPTNGPLIEEAESTGLFTAVADRSYVWPVEYDVDGYLALLDTFANHLVMEPAKRDHLYGEVRRLFAERPGGRVTRHWVSQPVLFRREPAA